MKTKPALSDFDDAQAGASLAMVGGKGGTGYIP